jgi:hypothetical protein
LRFKSLDGRFDTPFLVASLGAIVGWWCLWPAEGFEAASDDSVALEASAY